MAGAAVSAVLHLALFFGVPRAEKKVEPVKRKHVIALTIPLPDVKELEEPEPSPDDAAAPTMDLGMLVPMQQDLPQLPAPSDFVQQINFASLLEQPDFSQVKVYTIPENIRTAGKIADKIGKIFDLADLDRIPEPVFQPAPTYPIGLRREGISANVRVEFIVDPEGRVLNPVVVDSTEKRFDDAAVTGVAKWKFRAGVKGGRRVYTRMAVPIVFKVSDVLD